MTMPSTAFSTAKFKAALSQSSLPALDGLLLESIFKQTRFRRNFQPLFSILM